VPDALPWRVRNVLVFWMIKMDGVFLPVAVKSPIVAMAYLLGKK
jgi:hypothetical protein